MRGVASVLIAGGLGCAVWAGLTNHVPFAQAEPGAVKPIPAYAPASFDVALAETDDDRRARLNARLQTMVKEGKGARLTDSPPPVPRRRAEARSIGATLASSSSSSSLSPRRSGYVAPTLDLKTPPRVPDNDVECLTQAVYYEARNESEAGQAAVAEVVVNRSRHRAYPKRICEVVYQRNSRTCQFTFTCDGSIGRRAVNPVAWGRAERIAREVYEGRSANQLPKNSVNYHANYVRPSWGQRLARVRQIGAHIFYGSTLNGGSTPGAYEPPPPVQVRTLFVRNEALDQAYARMTAQMAAIDAPAAPAGS